MLAKGMGKRDGPIIALYNLDDDVWGGHVQYLMLEFDFKRSLLLIDRFTFTTR